MHDAHATRNGRGTAEYSWEIDASTDDTSCWGYDFFFGRPVRNGLQPRATGKLASSPSGNQQRAPDTDKRAYQEHSREEFWSAAIYRRFGVAV
jgi:hypothetical protein